MPQRTEYQQYVTWSQGVDDGSITDPEIVAKVARWRETIRRNRAAIKARRQAQSALRKAEKRAANDPEEMDPPPPEPEAPAPEPVVIPDFADVMALGQLEKLRLMEYLVELRDRQFETLRLYQPLPIQKQFHESDAHIRIIRGGNRSGKSTATLVELAWALTGTHPDPDKYPREGVKAIVIAKDHDKIGKVIWPLLGRPGAFRMVDDPETGQPRLERPGDRAAGLKLRDAPPLIPRRLIKAIQWVSLKASQPKTLIMKNGSECTFYSSESDPFSIQGTRLHAACLDEEVKNEGWFPEAIARLVDYGGRLFWGVTPQTGTQRLYDLGQRALEEQENEVEKPLIEEFLITIRDNPYITEEDKQMFILSLDDEEQIKIRVEGEHALAGFKIYAPYFHPRGIHAVEPFPIPHDWTRFAAIDPGSQVAAVVFAACPPKRRPAESALDAGLYGDFIYIYDEIYIKRCDAQKLAYEMKHHVGDQMIREILIDHHGGQLTEIGSGKSPEQQYKEAFKAARVPVPLIGRYFTWGSDDLQGGILKVKEYLRPRPDGLPKLRILRDAAPHLVSALGRYQWKVVNGVTTDKPLARHVDSADCLRYLVMAPGVRYHHFEGKTKEKKTAFEQFKEFQRRDLKRQKKKVGISL